MTAQFTQIANLLEKATSNDKDFRFMATNDLMNELQKDSIKLDDEIEKKVVKMVLRLLEDKNGEVQNQAVKCLGPVVNRVKEIQVEMIVDSLCANMVSNNEQLRDISSIGLKTVISEMPQNLSSLAPNVCQRITGKLSSAIEKEDISVKLEALDILADLLIRFGDLLYPFHDTILKALVPQLASPRQAVRKRTIVALSHLLITCSNTSYNKVIQHLLDGLEKRQNSATIRTHIQCLASICRQSGYRLCNHIDRAMTMLTEYSNCEDDELREYCLQACEAFVYRCPEAISSHIPNIESQADQQPQSMTTQPSNSDSTTEKENVSSNSIQTATNQVAEPITPPKPNKVKLQESGSLSELESPVASLIFSQSGDTATTSQDESCSCVEESETESPLLTPQSQTASSVQNSQEVMAVADDFDSDYGHKTDLEFDDSDECSERMNAKLCVERDVNQEPQNNHQRSPFYNQRGGMSPRGIVGPRPMQNFPHQFNLFAQRPNNHQFAPRFGPIDQNRNPMMAPPQNPQIGPLMEFRGRPPYPNNQPRPGGRIHFTQHGHVINLATTYLLNLMKRVYTWIRQKLTWSNTSMKNYIMSSNVSCDDPILILFFDRRGINYFVAEANNAATPPPNPHFGFIIRNFGNGVTSQTFMEDIIRYCQMVVPGIFRGDCDLGDVLFGPCHGQDYSLLIGQLTRLSCDTFIQHVMAGNRGVSIADLIKIEDKKLATSRFNLSFNAQMCPFSR